MDMNELLHISHIYHYTSIPIPMCLAASPSVCKSYLIPKLHAVPHRALQFHDKGETSDEILSSQRFRMFRK